MAASYLIEIRLGGEIKDRLRDVIREIADRFDERELVRSHYVPHITLYGPFRTSRESAVLDRLQNGCAEYDTVPFRIEGFDHFGRETIYADVHSSRPLRKLRWRLSRELQDVTTEEPDYDHNRWCKFHSTIARNVRERFDEIWDYVRQGEEIGYDGYVERVSLIRNGEILKEYTVPQGRFLGSEAATSKPAWERDQRLIERYGNERDHTGLVPSQPNRIEKNWTLFRDRLSFGEPGSRRDSEFESESPQRFVSGDLHLNHRNIIEYCDRPFDSVYEMNQQLVANWNDTVGPDDTVIFLGDLAFESDTLTVGDWLHALNGELVWVRGNHDRGGPIDLVDDYILETDLRRYYCAHRPEDVPGDWDGWALHGHVHNNDPQNHPFIDFEAQRINAAPELMGSTPRPIEALDVLIEGRDSDRRDWLPTKTSLSFLEIP